MEKKTLLVIVPGQHVTGDAVYSIVVAETGEGLASHLCSHAGYAYGDLYGNRPERIEEWSKRFGEVEVKYIDETDIEEPELFKRNQNWFSSLKKDNNTPSVNNQKIE